MLHQGSVYCTLQDGFDCFYGYENNAVFFLAKNVKELRYLRFKRDYRPTKVVLMEQP